MADIDFDGFGARPGSGRVQRLISGGAAVLSVALVLGMGLWGYRLAVRDVTGVPVIRAMSGPMRIAPDTPGGETAAHQGLAVNAVAAVGAASGPAERVVLAPMPVSLTDEDVAGLAASPVPPVSARAEGMVALALPEYPRTAPAPVISQGDAIAAALAEALGGSGGGAGPVEEIIVASATPLSGTLDGAAPVLRLASTMPRGAFASAVRPLPRPGSRPAGVTPAAAAGTAPVAPAVEVDPATLEAGARLVQLGAFETADLARAEWERVAGRFGPLMAGKARVVQEAQSGGRAFWRLRAQGFDSEADARRFCAALLAEKTSCIPVVLR